MELVLPGEIEMKPSLQDAGRRATGIALSVCLLLCGCVTTGSFLPGHVEKPPIGPVFQIVATWNKEVVFAPDPTRGGAPQPGLVGRIFLFGPELSFPHLGDGGLIVDLFDDAPVCQGKPAVHIEQWRFDKDSLRLLARKDGIGWGYTIFLPWGTYQPTISQVHLRVRFEPQKGAPIYQESSSLILAPTNIVGTVTSTSAKPKS